jgi:hypothetical protein
MNSNKLIKKSKPKILFFIPIVLFLIIGVACVIGQEKTKEDVVVDTKKQTNEKYSDKDVVSAVALPKMNVLYVGIDNPVKIAVSGYMSSELEVDITNGIIRGGDGEYIIKPRRPGNILMEIRVGGGLVEKTSFRVRPIPIPNTFFGKLRSGDVTKKSLLEQTEIIVIIPNFEFDLSFEVISYRMSLTFNYGFSKEFKLKSNKINAEQKEFIEDSCYEGSIIIFDEIKAKGPDGAIRTYAPIVFKII